MTTVPIPPSPSLPSLSVSDHKVLLVRRRAARGIATLAMRYGLVIGINLVGTVMLSRLLGPALWGVFAIAQLIYLSSQEVLGRGLATYLIKKEAAPSPADIRSTFALQHLFGLIFLCSAIAGAHPAAHWYGHDALYPLLLAAAVASYGYAWRSVPLALLERDFDYAQIAVIEVLENVFFYAAAIALVYMGYMAAGLALAVILRSWAPTLLAFVLKPVKPALRFHLDNAAAIADFGFAVAASSAVNIAVLSVPAILVGKISGMKALGEAQMAFSLYGNLLFVSAAVLRLNLSTYSRLAEHAGELARSVNQHLEILSVVLVPAIVVFAGLSPIWTVVVFGQKWESLPGLLLAQAPGYLFAAVFWGVLNPALLVSGKHRQLLLWLIAFAVVYTGLAWALIPRWGAVGVAVAFSAAEVWLHPLLFWMYSVLHGRLNYKKIFAEISTGVGSLALLWFAARHSVVGAGVVALLYLAFWFIRNASYLNSFYLSISSFD
jgi:O-antigen/teichoic acid export membrane protein